MFASKYNKNLETCTSKHIMKLHSNNEMGDLKKGPWRVEEDQVLINHVNKYGPREWSSIRSKGLLRRTGKSCRLRWVNKLRPDLKTGVKFTAEEERTVIDLQAQFGNKWAKIATYLLGRTDNDVKNFWSSRQKRLARILNTSSAPSSSNSHKKTKQLREASKSSSSTTDKSLTSQSCSSLNIHDPDTIKTVPFAETLNSNSLSYGHNPVQVPDFTPPEKNPFPEQQPLLSFPLSVESENFITKLGDTSFLDEFQDSSGCGMPSFMEPDKSFQFDEMVQSHDSVDIDCFTDDFPPIDMFDHIEPLPSPSEWS